MKNNNTKNNRTKNLFGNMALFTVGNFVSKLLVMLLVPFYTNVLTTAEYGIADAMQATLLLLVPLLTVNIGEAALRFGIEKSGRGRLILKNILIVHGIADLVVAVIGIGIYEFCKNAESIAGIDFLNNADLFGRCALLFVGLFICNSIYESMILFCQGCEKVQIMIIGSISCTVLVIAANLYFLLGLKIGLYGYLYSQMISFGGAAVIMLMLLLSAGVFAKEQVQAEADRGLLGDMVDYGKGMLLYSTSSWVNNALDRYFVLYMCGAAVNGLYGVAYKIPAILMVFQRIFAQAWQISANKSYEDEDSREFFEKAYNNYESLMIFCCSGLIMVVQLLAKFLFAKDFYEAWVLVPPLLMSVVFGAITGFCGSICLAFKDGKSMGRATGIGAIVNIVLNYIGIKMFGAMGAAFATLISYFIMYVFANRAVLKHVKLKIGRGRETVLCILLLIQTLAASCRLPYYYVYEVVCFVLVFAVSLKVLPVAMLEKHLL